VPRHLHSDRLARLTTIVFVLISDGMSVRGLASR